MATFSKKATERIEDLEAQNRLLAQAVKTQECLLAVQLKLNMQKLRQIEHLEIRIQRIVESRDTLLSYWNQMVGYLEGLGR